MLVTTCPDCSTTFRITDEILARANGKVRCGSCTRVFNANIALRELDEPAAAGPSPAGETVGPSPAQAEPETGDESGDWFLTDIPAEGIDSGPAPATAGEAVETDGEPEHAAESGADADSEAEVDPDTGLDDTAEKPALTDPDWLPALNEPQPSRTRLWTAGVAVLGVLLIGQLVHQLRPALAGAPGIGPLVQQAYDAIGVGIPVRVDLNQYDLVALSAVAEPVGGEPGWLVIETRVQNRGPKVQPFPHIFVRLVNRWEETIAGRYFAPQEYALGAISDVARMNVGRTIDAQFIIVDPGPSATGFKLEFCTPVEQEFFCEADAVFN